MRITSSKYIKAADEDYEGEEIVEDSLDESIDQVSDQIEDLQESVDEVQEDDPGIEVDNNIENHMIAECENCHGIFISPVIDSDANIDKVSGVCPICNKETDQYLKWVIKRVE